MSQLDLSIFYSHLFGLLLMLYIFANFSVMIISTYFYNQKLRALESNEILMDNKEVNNVNILIKVLS